jgi:nucleotide-binding universal stress UspA family protein
MPQTIKPYVIVVAVDYSESGRLALERAFELAAEKPKGELHVVNVLPVHQSGVADAANGAWVGSLPSIEEASEQLRSYVDKASEVFRLAHPGTSCEFLDGMVAHQRLSAPSEEIAQLASDVEADLIVVGTHGRRGVPRLILGSVAEATLRLAPCPVLVVRPKAIPAPGPAIEPPCPRCVEARKHSQGKEFWCEQHRERHGQRHTYHQNDRIGADTNMPLVVRS